VTATLVLSRQLRGSVTFGDFQILAEYFGSSGSWDEGNFTYNSVVDFGDFQLLAQDFGANSLSDLTTVIDPPPPTVTLTIVASDGIYSVYANDTSTDNVGIVSFDIDVQGDGGAEVTSSYNYAPQGRGTVEYNGSTYHPQSGFNVMDGDGDNGEEITAMQNVVYGTTDNEFDDAKVIKGFGQSSGTDGSLSWTQTNVGVLVASGTYSGSGTLSVNVHSGAYVQVLSIVSSGQWSGPGNMMIAQVTGDTINV